GRKDAAAISHRCHGALTIVAAPVRGTSGLTGIVYASGARAGATVDEAAAAIGTATGIGTAPEAATLAAAAPGLTDADLVRVKVLVAEAAAAVERKRPIRIPPTTFTHPCNDIVGDAPAVRDVVKLLGKVVKSEA